MKDCILPSFRYYVLSTLLCAVGLLLGSCAQDKVVEQRSAQGGSEDVTKKLWRDAGVRVVPGKYLARDQADGSNPGADYIRVAMVQDKETTAEALERVVAVLG